MHLNAMLFITQRHALIILPIQEVMRGYRYKKKCNMESKVIVMIYC